MVDRRLAQASLLTQISEESGRFADERLEHVWAVIGSGHIGECNTQHLLDGAASSRSDLATSVRARLAGVRP